MTAPPAPSLFASVVGFVEVAAGDDVRVDFAPGLRVALAVGVGDNVGVGSGVGEGVAVGVGVASTLGVSLGVAAGPRVADDCGVGVSP